MDIYDKHIGNILDDITIVKDDWGSYKPLFKTCAGHYNVGCLTQVRNLSFGPTANIYGLSEDIFNKIRVDDRLHYEVNQLISSIEEAISYKEIVEILYPYAEWQRRFDSLFSR